MLLSISQITCLLKSEAERGGKYILKIKQKDQTYFTVGKIFHRVCQGITDKTTNEKFIKDGEEIKKSLSLLSEEERIKIEKQVENLKQKREASPYYFVPNEDDCEKEVKWSMFGCDWIGYIDYISEKVIDFKSSYYLTKEDKFLEKYGLQAYAYMVATGFDTCEFIEIAKFDYTKKQLSEHSQSIIFTMDQVKEYAESIILPSVERIKELHRMYQPYIKGQEADTDLIIDDMIDDE